MTNSEDVFREAVEDARMLYPGNIKAQQDRIVRLHTAHTQALREKLAALEAENAKYQRLRAIVNDNRECLPACSSYGHEDDCPRVNMAIWLETCRAENERLTRERDEAQNEIANVRHVLRGCAEFGKPMASDGPLTPVADDVLCEIGSWWDRCERAEKALAAADCLVSNLKVARSMDTCSAYHCPHDQEQCGEHYIEEDYEGTVEYDIDQIDRQVEEYEAARSSLAQPTGRENG